MKTIVGVIFLVFLIIIGMSEIEKDRALFYNSLGYSISAETDSNSTSEESEQTIEVNITGEVNNPGTYEIKSGGYLEEIIDQAGGVTSLADTDCFDYYLVIEEKIDIYIPPISETEKVSINYADIEKLMTLTGVGRTLANRIVEYREEIAYFTYLEQLMEVEGIGKSIFNKIKDTICL